MAFTVVVSTGRLVDYRDDDSYAVNENGVLTVTIANPRFTRQVYSPSGWLEVVETNQGIDAGATRTVIGHKPRS
jgi:hypothetical protein